MRHDISARNRALLEADGFDARAIAAAEAVTRALGDDEALERVASRSWIDIPSPEAALPVVAGMLEGGEHCAVVLRVTDPDGTERTFLLFPDEETA